MTNSAASTAPAVPLHQQDHTRHEALENGELIDVSNVALDAGIEYHTAVTRAVWDEYIVPLPAARAVGQGEARRVWDVLYMYAHQRRQSKDTGEFLHIRVPFMMEQQDSQVVTLKVRLGLGDNAEPVLTVMMPNEQ